MDGGLPPGFPPVPEDFNPEELGFPPNVDRNFAWVLFLQTVAAQQSGHGHSHGGQPCHGHGGGDDEEEEQEEDGGDATGAAIEEMMHTKWEGDLLDKETAFECFKEITAMSVSSIEESLKPESMQAAMSHPEGMQGFIAESMEKKVKDIYAKYNVQDDAQLHATLGHYAKSDPEFAARMRAEDEAAMGALSQATAPMLGGMMGGPMGMPMGMPMPGQAFGGAPPGMDITDLTQMAAMMGLGPAPGMGAGAGAGAGSALQIEEVEEEPKKGAKPAAKAEEKKGDKPAAAKPAGGAASLMMGRGPLAVKADGSINVSSAALDPTAMLFGGSAPADATKKK